MNNRHYRPLPARHHRGASLIEVLVAVLILTVGLLSMISLHAASMRYGKMAEFKTSATQLAEDLADRMRSNLPGVYSGDYVVALPSNDNRTLEAVPGIPTCTATDGTCEAILGKAVAQRDVVEWLNQAYPNLPGLGLVMQQPGGLNSSVMDVWIGWLEPTGRATDAAADQLINDAYTCPPGMNASAQVRCMRFSFTL